MNANFDDVLRDILALHRRPAPFAPGTANIWTDAHLSAGMLEAHLSPDNDSASYAPARRQAALDWIAREMPPEAYPRVLDIGCGPGLYAQALARRGYRVTGIDFSARSIAYAKEADPSVRYLHGDYLETDFAPEGPGYDLAIMISCDLGVLAPKARALLLRKACDTLRPGGRLLLDVLTTTRPAPKDGERRWEAGDGGYWSPGPYLLLEDHYRYPGHNICRQSILWDRRGVRAFHIWDHRYAPQEMTDALREAGFSHVRLHGDLAGAPFEADAPYLCALAQRP